MTENQEKVPLFRRKAIFDKFSLGNEPQPPQTMREKATVYIETTIPSYLTARLSGDLITAGEQAITREWWEQRRAVYRLFISEAVVEEAGRGDVDASRRRLEAISGLEAVAIDEPAIELAEKLLENGLIPQKAAADAIHIAVAARHGMDYILTWNCRHLANAEIIRQVSHIVAREGYYVPIICTPRELFGGQENEE